jgi:hypothetical protein
MGHRRNGRAASLLLSLSLPLWGLLTGSAQAQIGIGISINIAPPELPVYEQPAVPGPGYLWTPGYWSWSDGDYVWVPGTWVEPPQAGFLWTPGYWGWGDGAYLWHGGYWGEHIGFYGGVNYGHGYGGSGYEGGYWQHDHFFYNSSVNNIRGNTQITNVYNKTVINNVNTTHVSFNGGTGGVAAQPTAVERAAASERHVQPVQAQVQHERVALATPSLRASVNHGQPPIAATARPGELRGPGVVPAARSEAHIAPATAARSEGAQGSTARPEQRDQPAGPRAAALPATPASAPHVAPERAAAERPAPEHVAPEHAAPVAPERLAARPPAPAAPHDAAPRPAPPHPPAQAHPPAPHAEQGGEHDHER